MTRPRARAALTTLVLLGLTGPAAAQDDELPEEAALRQALAGAQARYEEAMRLVEAYGRGAPVGDAAARAAGLERLHTPVTPGRARRRAPPPPFQPWAARDELVALREAVAARLRALAPERHPPVDDDDPEDDASAPRATLRLIDVQDLLVTPEDHVAPNTGLGAGLDASGAFDAAGERTSGVGLEGDKLVELALDAAGRLASDEALELRGGRLMARLRPATAARVTHLLAELRRGRGGLIDLEVRVYELGAAAYEALREEAAALGDAAEARLAAGGDGVRLLASHHVTAHDGQRVHVWRGRSRSYLADIEVNQTGVVPVLNPVVAVINEGLVVEARPTVDRARGVAVVDVSLSLSRVADPVPTTKVVDLELELPRLRIARTTATGAVPLGRGALLGGVLRTGAEPEEALTCVVYVRPRLIAGQPGRGR
ncbi:MAG: hypothetical protein KF878_37745 [Planctomycetes bacterium]|nr:hypothetical protein [Planctomycetota bacterium]